MDNQAPDPERESRISQNVHGGGGRGDGELAIRASALWRGTVKVNTCRSRLLRAGPAVGWIGAWAAAPRAPSVLLLLLTEWQTCVRQRTAHVHCATYSSRYPKFQALRPSRKQGEFALQRDFLLRTGQHLDYPIKWQ
jgi:hypothetical protein